MSYLSTKIVCVKRGPTVVRSFGDFSIWVRSGISLPLVIFSNSIYSASRIIILIVDNWGHILALYLSDTQERRWRTGRESSVWMDV